MDEDRRSLLVGTLLMAGLAGCRAERTGPANHSFTDTHRNSPDPHETFVLPHDNLRFKAWGHLPARSGEMAALYGNLNSLGPYLVVMRWNPGWFSAPHTYATDRICVVVSGTWWVNSGDDFEPDRAVPEGRADT